MNWKQVATSSADRRLMVLVGVVAAVPIIALSELTCCLVQTGGGLQNVDRAQLKQAVASSLQAGDLLVAAPAPMQQALLSMGAEATTTKPTLYAEPSSMSRATEIALGGAVSRELSGWERLTETRVGAVRVRTWRNPKAMPAKFDLVGAVLSQEAQVTSGPAGGSGTPCAASSNPEADLPAGSPIPWAPRPRYQCQGDARMFVGVVALEDRLGRVRRCIATFPTTNAVRVRFPKAPAAQMLRAEVAVRNWPGSTDTSEVQLRFKVSGATVHERKVKGEASFEPFDVPTPMLGAAGGAIEFEVEQASQSQALVCVEASLR